MSEKRLPAERPAGRQRVLLIDDSPDAGVCRQILAQQGHEVEVCRDPQLGLSAAMTGDFDAILLELVLPGLDGMTILKNLKAEGVLSSLIVVTAHPSVDAAVEAMKRGAADYLGKPVSPEQLHATLAKAWEGSVTIRENAEIRRELEVHRGFEGILGESRPMQRVFALIKRVAPTDGTVLVTGESGTGKEMVVRAIHRLSRRKDRPLLACDCTALAPTLLESELFGHVKGSFSGAIATKQGLFEVADEGTLFLDEVANLSMETQGKLLRVLETRQVRKVGDTVEHEVDIRLVAATNRDLGELARAGTFREDLYYRLNVVPIALPPLRERSGDIPILASAFLRRFCKKMDVEVAGFTPEAAAHLESYHWPGNVRELRNIVERVAILCEGDSIDVSHLPLEVRQAPARAAVAQLPHTWEEFRKLKEQVTEATVQDLESRFVTQALERAEGNVSRAARDVGMQRPNFHKLMRKYNVTASNSSSRGRPT